MMFGQKLKLMNALDKAMADNSKDLFTIELLLTKSPRKGVKCGAIAIYMLSKQSDQLDWKADVDPLEKFQAEQSLNEMTDVMIRPLEMFKADDGRWLNFALPRVLEIFDEFFKEAKIVIKSPKLKVKHVLTKEQILKGRGNPRTLFKTAFDIDALLTKDFNFDPWSKQIRRGHVGANFK